jgi:hypothetical protein
MLSVNGKRVYRSSSQRTWSIMSIFFFNAIAIDFILQYPGRPPVIVFAVLYGCVFTLGFGRLATAGVFATHKGVQVKNIFSGFSLRWDEIDRFAIGRWKLLPYTCLIYLRDGSMLHAIGIEENTNFANGSAEEIVRELNDELASRRPLASGDDRPIEADPGSAQSELFRQSRDR